MARLDEAQDTSVGSRIALAGHPIHAMMVTFPIALVVATLGADIFWWLAGDPFFVRVGLWTSGWGFGMGVLAGLVGTAELLAGAGIRRRPESWNHAIAAMMLLAVIGANWGLRLAEGADGVLPWGLVLSLTGLVFVGMAGWQGGKLVFEHQVGVMMSDEQERPGKPVPHLPEVASDPAR